MPARRLSILVVDDQAFVRVLLTDSLREAGYEVVTAADGEAALEALKRGGVDLLITDMVMPNRDGVQTITSARIQFPGLKILAMSGDRNADVYLRTAQSLGAQAVLPKPFDKKQLLAVVKKVLG